jgi:ABC-type sulfate transport system permease component
MVSVLIFGEIEKANLPGAASLSAVLLGASLLVFWLQRHLLQRRLHKGRKQL